MASPTHSDPTEIQSLLKQVENSSRRRPSHYVSSFRQLDAPPSNFSGRIALLDQIHQRMLHCATKPLFTERLLVIDGLEGMGKSSLARMYAHAHQNHRAIQNVAWIDAENKYSLEASFVSLAHKLNLPTSNKNIQEIVQDIYTHFSVYIGYGLFIFDNAPTMMATAETGFGIFDFLPRQQNLNRRPLVLITTRDLEWADIPRENVLEIDTLSDLEALEFVGKSLQLTSGHENHFEEIKVIRHLTQTLRYYPLALSLAAATISQNHQRVGIRQGVSNYVKQLNLPTKGDGDWVKVGIYESSKIYKLILDRVLDVSLSKIKDLKDPGMDSFILLNFIAYLPSEEITVERVHEIFEFVFERQSDPEGFLILEKFALISIKRDKNDRNGEIFHKISVHQLIQRCLRERLEADDVHDYSFAFGICYYLLHQDPNKDILNKRTCTWMHKYLKRRNWPEDSITFSVIFASRALKSGDGDKNDKGAWKFLPDIRAFFKRQDNEEHIHVDVVNLFYLCLFHFYENKNRTYRQQYILKEASLPGKLEKIFLSCVNSALNWKELPIANPANPMAVSKIVQKQIFDICREIMNGTVHFLRKELGQNEGVVDLLILSANDGSKSQLQEGDHTRSDVNQIYRSLWDKCSKADNPVFAMLYVNAIVKLHEEFYIGVEQRSETELKEYWDEGTGGPLQYEDIFSRLWGDKYDEWNTLFSESFFQERGPKILVDNFKFLMTLKEIPYCSTYILKFITRLAYDWKCAHKFVESSDFMKCFYTFTRSTSELRDNDNPIMQGHCLATWFALFSQNETLKDSEGREWSIRCVTDEMKSFFRKTKDSFFREDILEVFLKASKSDCESAAVKLASRFIKAVKY